MIDPAFDESKRLADTTRPLFIEFGKKLSAMRDEALHLHDKIARFDIDDGPAFSKPTRQNERFKLVNHYHAILRRLESLEKPMHKLIRQLSQRIEHTSIDEIVRIELEARMDDLQSEIKTTRDYITTYLP